MSHEVLSGCTAVLSCGCLLCRLLVAGCRLLLAACCLLLAACCLLLAGCWLPFAGCRLPVAAESTSSADDACAVLLFTLVYYIVTRVTVHGGFASTEHRTIASHLYMRTQKMYPLR